VRCHATESGALVCESLTMANPVILETVRACQSGRYPDETYGGKEPLVCQFLEREVHAAAIVPLHLERQPIGGLWVGRLQPDPYSPTDLIALERLADQAVIAITHAFMASRMQSLAVIEERSRIAREMHDGLAQILGYLGLETQTMEALVRQGEHGALLARLGQVRQNIDLAQADIRENILSLRTTLAGDEGAIPALGEYLEEFSLQTGIEVQYRCDLQGELQLSPMAETQMLRIVQEALSNVRKHARARAVQVRLAWHDGCLCVTVTDDGIGFEPGHEPGHYGLHTMRERAESVGGGLTIDSSIGQGTQVELWLPKLPAQSAN
jgi:signal transduction histidine kinase